MYFIVLLLLATLFLLGHFGFFLSKRLKLAHKIPGPKGLPFFGNLFLALTSVDQMWEALTTETVKYWPTVKAYFGPFVLINVGDPDDLETLLSSQKYIDKGMAYHAIQPWLKSGLLTSTGSKWRSRRRILTPAFHFNVLKKYMDITQENGKKFIEALKDEGDETIQSLVPFCSKYTLNIICESAMGVALDSINYTVALNYKKAVYSMGKVVVYRATRPFITDWIMNFMWKLKKTQNAALKTLTEFTEKVLKERKDYHKNTNYKYLKSLTNDNDLNSDDFYGGKKKRLAMLDLLLSAEMENLIDDDGIKEEVDTFMFEGHDTTGMAMTFTLMLLAEHQDIQEKARAEVTEFFAKNNGNFGLTELQELSYLERCIKESLRMYPPVPIISRLIKEDVPLKNYVLPVNTEIFFQLYLIHRDPKYWPEPDKFDPDRFLPERILKRHPYCYIPFSAGPRNCIGQKFALMELKALIGRILYNFKLEPVDRLSNMKISLDIVLRPSKPIRTKFIKIRQ